MKKLIVNNALKTLAQFLEASIESIKELLEPCLTHEEYLEEGDSGSLLDFFEEEEVYSYAHYLKAQINVNANVDDLACLVEELEFI